MRRRVLNRAGGWRSARVPLDSAHGRTLGAPENGLAPFPLSNRRNRPRRRPAASPRLGQPHGGLRLGCAKVLAQRPAESRGFLRLCPSARGKSLQQQTGWRSGQSSANPSLRPNSLIYGKIQGICADLGSRGLASGPDSLACTRTCAPRSLEPGTGNFVPRSRDSPGQDAPWKVPDRRGAAPLRAFRSQAPKRVHYREAFLPQS
jgi:hypothetical protein